MPYIQRTMYAMSRPMYAVLYACRDGKKHAFTASVRLYARFGTYSLIQMCKRDACEAPDILSIIGDMC